MLTPAQITQYHKDGFLVLKNFCNKQEVDKLYSVAVQDDAMRKNALDLNDQAGKKLNCLYGSLPETMSLAI